MDFLYILSTAAITKEGILQSESFLCSNPI